jgi:hypothetical protein
LPEETVERSISKGRNFNNTTKLKPIFDTHKHLQSDPSMKSISPREIMPTFHRKSHFKALTSVFLKQGQGSQIINTTRPEGDPEDNKFVEKLMLAINKTQAQAVA